MSVDVDAGPVQPGTSGAIARALRRTAAPVLKAVPVVSRATWHQQGISAGMTSANYHGRGQVIVASTGIRFVYTNTYLRETLPGNDIIVRAGLETPTGTFYPVFFNGRRSVTIEPGGIAISDPVPIEVAAGDFVWHRTFVSAASGGWPLGDSRIFAGTWQEGGDTSTNAVDQSISGSIVTTSTFMFGPIAMLGIPKTTQDIVVVAGVGDSIVFGQGDSPAGGPVAAGKGFFERAMNNTYPFVKIACSGELASNFKTYANRQVRSALLAGCTHSVCNYGINDVANGNALATMQADLTAVWQVLADRGIAVYQTTITPKTTSTDGWVTTVNQTVTANETRRTQLNDWIRTTPTGLAGYIEIADTVETARNSGIWKAGYTTDGTHPIDTAHALMAVPAAAAAASFALSAT